ncbi:DUF6929 family protein [Longimicrobium sp.]|uniref:DUF6929 family protein n=1 Tax=Longimicrobium sp. TaxID=2029185 RepID=UPI002BB4C277|nr:hypothetical protein [Longimicrobium sp.]HSU16934.1 hypothetical protein [Longimicrobium sp.]
MTTQPTVRAILDPTLGARVVRSVPLLYAEGADAALDRPAHVRAASGMALVAGRVAVVQDDANFVALVDPETGRASALTLPAGEGGARQFDDERGNKRWKLDLECCAVLRDGDGREVLAAFGSGSSPERERIVLVRGIGSGDAEIAVAGASALYGRLRAETAFAGSELNVEGVALAGGVLRLFNRGNGAPHGDLRPVNATCEIGAAALLAFLRDPALPPPEPRNVTQYELGEIGGFPLTFTDAAAFGDAILFTAAAEDSPDATRDGPVAGSAIGIIRGGEARLCVVRNADGSRYAGKIEGILPHAPGRLWAVIDRDEPGTPSELSEVVLEGDW